MNIFLDTNIMLSLYGVERSTLQAISGVLTNAKSDAIHLYYTDQVRREFERQRENVVSRAISDIGMGQLKVPAYVVDMHEYEAIRNEFNDLQARLKVIQGQLERDAVSRELPADKVVEELWKAAKRISVETDHLIRARERDIRNDPPRKANSHGDGISWEALLDHSFSNNQLTIASLDGDWASERQGMHHIHPYLVWEWQERHGKSAKLDLARGLDELPGTDELLTTRRRQLVEELRLSGSFSETHQILSRLSGYNGMTRLEDEILIDALNNNSQVSAIILDSDVLDFYLKFIVQRYGQSQRLSELTERSRLDSIPTLSPEVFEQFRVEVLHQITEDYHNFVNEEPF